jgi:hypothetical protein
MARSEKIRERLREENASRDDAGSGKDVDMPKGCRARTSGLYDDVCSDALMVLKSAMIRTTSNVDVGAK